MNKETYARFKERGQQERLGHQMARDIDGKRSPVPNRKARRRMSKFWQRIEMGKA